MTAWETTRRPKMKGLSQVPLTFDLAILGEGHDKHARQFSDKDGNVWVAIAIYKLESKVEMGLAPLAKGTEALSRKEYWYKMVATK